ncbi:MAG: DNA polymerase I, partial [Acidobacteriota bacterium]
DEIYDQYKANRPPPPEELAPQFPLAIEVCSALGWPQLMAQGFEADDVIATLTEQARARGLRVVIVTSDKDLYQLVEEDVAVLNPAKEDRVLDPDGVEEVFGVRPEHVVDVLALMGDKVDNVPGVPGIGEKTAKAMVRRYGGVDTIRRRAGWFAELWQVRERALEQLRADDADAWRRSLRELAEPAAALSALEGSLAAGPPDGLTEDLVRRFEAAARLAALSGVEARSARKVLNDLGKKTQPKAWLAIAEHDAQLELSRSLVTVRRDAPVELDLDAMRPEQPDAAAAAALFRRLGFGRLTKEYEQLAGEVAAAGESLEVQILDTREALEEALSQLRESELVAFDTETTSLDARRSKLVGVSLACSDHAGFYLPVGHLSAGQLDWELARERLARVLADEKIGKVAQNAKFDIAVLHSHGLSLRGLAFDTLIAAQLLEPGRSVSHKLDDLAHRYLGERLIAYHDVAGSGDEEQTLDRVPIEQVARYAVEDAVITWRLAGVLRERLREQDLLELMETVETPLVGVLEQIERHGIRLDVGQLEAMSARLAARIASLEDQIHQLAGHPFNIQSPQQLRDVLFKELQLEPTGRRTQKKRAHSTGQEVLESLAEQHELPALVLEYRELTKLKSTYVDALPKLVGPADQRIHGQFHQLGAATGRLSSSDPNLQNIPVRTELGREIRAAFVPQEGWSFVSADYSQMELRILAHLSDDPQLIRAFREGQDVHRYTAALVAGVPIEEVSAEMRAQAKAVNFGIIYGMSEFRLAREQKMTREAARGFIQAYFERYPQVKAYIDGVIDEVQRSGEVRTLFGRVRLFPELLHGAGGDRLSRLAREQLLRQAVNATVQGTAADIVKMAMVRLAAQLEDRGHEARLLLQVHDELLLEAPPDELEALTGLVRRTMEGVARLEVPLKVDVGVADNWAGAH